MKFRHDSYINFKTYFIKKACLVQHSNDGIIVVPLGNADIPFLKEEVRQCASYSPPVPLVLLHKLGWDAVCHLWQNVRVDYYLTFGNSNEGMYTLKPNK